MQPAGAARAAAQPTGSNAQLTSALVLCPTFLDVSWISPPMMNSSSMQYTCGKRKQVGTAGHACRPGGTATGWQQLPPPKQHAHSTGLRCHHHPPYHACSLLLARLPPTSRPLAPCGSQTRGPARTRCQSSGPGSVGSKYQGVERGQCMASTHASKLTSCTASAAAARGGLAATLA